MKTGIILFTVCLLVVSFVGCGISVPQKDFEALQKQVDNLMQENQQLKEAAATEQIELPCNSNSSTLPVDFDTYHQIKAGMRYEEIYTLIGDYGIKAAVVGENTDKVLTTMKWNAYDAHEQWVNTAESFVFCKFENDILTEKWAELDYIYWDFSKISLEQFKSAYPNAEDYELSNFIDGLIAGRYFIVTDSQIICRIPSSKWYRGNRFAVNDPARDEAELPSSNEAWDSIMQTLFDSVK